MPDGLEKSVQKDTTPSLKCAEKFTSTPTKRLLSGQVVKTHPALEKIERATGQAIGDCWQIRRTRAPAENSQILFPEPGCATN